MTHPFAPSAGKNTVSLVVPKRAGPVAALAQCRASLAYLSSSTSGLVELPIEQLGTEPA
jgi:hypothetical protein